MERSSAEALQLGAIVPEMEVNFRGFEPGPGESFLDHHLAIKPEGKIIVELSSFTVAGIVGKKGGI